MSISSELEVWIIPARNSSGEGVCVCGVCVCGGGCVCSCPHALGKEAVGMIVDLGMASSEAECQLRPS
jgi:hypothetical protein